MKLLQTSVVVLSCFSHIICADDIDRWYTGRSAHMRRATAATAAAAAHERTSEVHTVHSFAYKIFRLRKIIRNIQFMRKRHSYPLDFTIGMDYGLFQLWEFFCALVSRSAIYISS